MTFEETMTSLGDALLAVAADIGRQTSAMLGALQAATRDVVITLNGQTLSGASAFSEENEDIDLESE